MIYFSEFKGKKVCTEDRVYIGLLEDLVFSTVGIPEITKLIVRGQNGKIQIVPISFLNKITQEITIEKNYLTAEVVENELYILRNLLDKQIIDLKGNKVVRVNDVVIQDKPIFTVSGVDVGLLGIFRRIKLDKLIINIYSFFGSRISSEFLSWADIQPIELARGHVKLNRIEGKLNKVRPEDLAFYLKETSIENIKNTLEILDPEKATLVIKNLNLNYQLELFKHFKPNMAVIFLSLMDADEAVDVLLTLPGKKRQLIIEKLSEKKRNEINYLLQYTSTPVGNLLNNEFITVFPSTTVMETITKIKEESADFFSLPYVFVTNKENQLIGVFNLHELLLQKNETPVYKFMTQNVIVVHLTTPQDIAFNKFIKYKLTTLPVIDEKKRILGVLTLSKLYDLFLKNR